MRAATRTAKPRPPARSTRPSTWTPGWISASAASPIGNSAEAGTAATTAITVARTVTRPPRRRLEAVSWRRVRPRAPRVSRSWGSSPVARARAVPMTANPKTRTTRARASTAFDSRSMASPTGSIFDRSSGPEGLTRARSPPAACMAATASSSSSAGRSPRLPMPYMAAVRPCSSQNDGSSQIRPPSDSKIVPGWAWGLRARSRGVRTIAPTVWVTIVVGSAACPLPTRLRSSGAKRARSIVSPTVTSRRRASRSLSAASPSASGRSPSMTNARCT